MEETIYYKSPLGPLQVSARNEAITTVSFVKETAEVDLDHNKPASTTLSRCIKQLDDYFAGRLFSFDLLLDQPGTDFQQKVWAELCHIKYGKTISYLELSKRLGNTKAIRAAGTANGRNNIAIIVPCHRVIGSDGSLVGYAGSLWRKKWLLEHEGRYGNGVQTLF
jgi:methylated-DNA-[protein]-cysteine S-methyltransferase